MRARVSNKCHIRAVSHSGQNERLCTWAQARDKPEMVAVRVNVPVIFPQGQGLFFIYMYISTQHGTTLDAVCAQLLEAYLWVNE